MATLIQQLYSQSHWDTIDGVQTIWNFTFSGGYILPAHVKAYYIDVSGARTEVPVTEDMLIGEFQLQVIPAIPANAQRFVIYRDTPKDLPLVDFEGGAVVNEPNMDRAAKQAVFCAAEVLDGAGMSFLTDDIGFKMMKQMPYTGSSVVQTVDNGKSHYKTDATAVSVPDTLSVTFLSTIINDHATLSMTITFASALAIMQGGSDAVGKASWVLAPRQSLSIMHVANGRWFISGKAV